MTRKILLTSTFILSYSTLLLLSSCKKDESNSVPTVTTASITEITTTTAVIGGAVTNDGGAAITARGVCWGTANNPTISNSKTEDGTGTGSFTSNITGLAPNTTYYVRAYATNTEGTGYGTTQTLATLSTTPIVTTNAVDNITTNKASCGGNVLSIGGAELTARGVCWSVNPNPTINDNITTDGAGAGAFTSQLTNLTSKEYYVRAYATNSFGTSYGNEVYFYLGVKDIDGNIYRTIQVGHQIWMAEDLKTTRYANGTPIELVTDNTAWNNLSTTDKAYCFYNNNENEAYGALYTWAAAMNGAPSNTSYPSNLQGVCPDGWQLPSYSAWVVLMNTLGGENYAGGAMKEAGISHWQTPNTGATNSSGFTALPTGSRNDGTFNNMGMLTIWWSATGLDETQARGYRTHYNTKTLDWMVINKKDGHPVRCMKIDYSK